MNVSLTPELESFISKKVESGRYSSASEVIREALRLLEEQEGLRAARLAEFQGELVHRLAETDHGTIVSPAALRKELRDRSRARRKSP
jgi:antitoxin ParD1/3/4